MVYRIQDPQTDSPNQTGRTSIIEVAGPIPESVGDIPNLGGGSPQIVGIALVKALVAVALAVWFGIVVLLGARGAFVAPSGTPPIPIALGFGMPLIVFLAAVWASAPFRNFLTTADLPLLTAVQAWRFAGFGFIALNVHGVLPGAFAWPAGLGDIAIGVTAPWLAIALIRRPAVAASRLFVVWNLLGILDLIVAVGTGALNQLLASGAAGEITTTPMAQMPLVLIPAFLVPLFVMLHLTGLGQARRLAQVSGQGQQRRRRD